ncbi:MAG: hypothetical protein LH473_06965 [Chitinophagales bacterium]|nr:hypothetical protein [Chitinophagales bacterium]
MNDLKSKSVFITAMILISFLFVSSSCSQPKSKKKDQQVTEKESKKSKKDKNKQTEITPASPDADDNSCDSSLWIHVYNPSRLQVIDQCKVVTGIIEETGPDDDGDEHLLLKLDAGQENVVNKKNVKEKNGDLVIEIVCANSVTLPAAKTPCKGYLNNIKIPAVGAHVKVTGSYVIDSHNGWAEIHPVTKIEEMK